MAPIDVVDFESFSSSFRCFSSKIDGKGSLAFFFDDMILFFFVLLLSFAFNISSAESSIIKKCEAPFHPINQSFNLTTEQAKFPTHYIFMLNTNLDNGMQEQILSIYHSMTCMIPVYSNATNFYLITLGENNNSTKINYGSDPSKWFEIFEKNKLENPEKKNQKVINICEQLSQGLNEFVFKERNRKLLMNGLKNFVMFQMIDDYEPEQCADIFYGFFFLTHTVGLSQNVITFGSSLKSQQPLSPPINKTAAAFDNPRFYTGASLHLQNFYGFNSNNNILYASIEPFVTEMVTTSVNFVKTYADINETVYEFIEDLLVDLPPSKVSNKKDEALSSPSINTVTIFAVILVILLLAFIIIVSSYDQSFFTDRNYIRERAVRFRRNQGRRNTDTVGLVEVPLDTLSETFFGESPRIHSFCEEPLLDLTQTDSSEESSSTINVAAAPYPNLIIQIDDDNLSEVKLGE